MRRENLTPVAARRLLGALTLATFGDARVCLWLKVCGAQTADQKAQEAA